MAESSSQRSIRIEESAVGSAVVSGDGNTIYVIHQTTEQHRIQVPSEAPTKIGPNPYKGLAAFKESDADRYFGREAQVTRLWQKFQKLYEQSYRKQASPRFLLILGPSGCGKSSLARAGLIPELARQAGQLGKTALRVAVMVPGTRPVEALAGVLAKTATNDPIPVEKAEEFERVLLQNRDGTYDGLRRITSLIPDVSQVPLVILVDQFEEVYSLCKDSAQRQIFIDTLLHAARDPARNVSVVVTFRSDFWVETQQHRQLNQVIGSGQTVNIPVMTEEELRRAVAEPARRGGHPLEEAVVDLLVKDTAEREGALPLLQFALTRIWEGLSAGKTAAEAYREMKGVGGALAGKAQQIYDELTEPEQKIARRVFTGLVQLGEGTCDTRRRVAIRTLIAKRDTPDMVHQVIRQFSSPGARLITLSNLEVEKVKEKEVKEVPQEALAEVTHEALLEHWQTLKKWLSNNRDDLSLQRRLETASQDWDEKNRPRGKLWRPPDLNLLRDYYKRKGDEMTPLQIKFLTASTSAQWLLNAIVSTGIVAILTTGFFAWQQWQGRQANELLASTTGDVVRPELIPAAEQLVNKADRLSQSTQPTDIDAALSYYRAVIGFCQALTATNLEDPDKVEDIRTSAEAGLVKLISAKRLGVLEAQLTTIPPQIGDRTGAQRTDFDNQFSEGALQTTYAILRRQEGAKADIYDSGQINTYKEAERMPCQLLEKIERIWREHTQNTCGWYSKEDNHPFFDSGCGVLGGRTLTAKVFNGPYDAAIERLQICGLVPEAVDLDRPF